MFVQSCICQVSITIKNNSTKFSLWVNFLLTLILPTLTTLKAVLALVEANDWDNINVILITIAIMKIENNNEQI